MGNISTMVQRHEVRQEVRHLDDWDCDLIFVFYKDQPFTVVRQLCDLLGILKPESQIEQLRERELLEDVFLKLPVNLEAGYRTTWCLHIDIVGWWFGHISDKRVRPEVRPQLLRLQWDVIKACKSIFLKQPDGDYVTRREYNQLAQFTLVLEDQIRQMQEQGFTPPPHFLLPPAMDDDE